jgi:hypothetical protein
MSVSLAAKPGSRERLKVRRPVRLPFVGPPDALHRTHGDAGGVGHCPTVSGVRASWRVPTVLLFSGSGMAFGGWFAGVIYDSAGFYAIAFAAGVLAHWRTGPAPAPAFASTE